MEQVGNTTAKVRVTKHFKTRIPKYGFPKRAEVGEEFELAVPVALELQTQGLVEVKEISKPAIIEFDPTLKEKLSEAKATVEKHEAMDRELLAETAKVRDRLERLVKLRFEDKPSNVCAIEDEIVTLEKTMETLLERRRRNNREMENSRAQWGELNFHYQMTEVYRSIDEKLRPLAEKFVKRAMSEAQRITATVEDALRYHRSDGVPDGLRNPVTILMDEVAQAAMK